MFALSAALHIHYTPGSTYHCGVYVATRSESQASCGEQNDRANALAARAVICQPGVATREWPYEQSWKKRDESCSSPAGSTNAVFKSFSTAICSLAPRLSYLS